MQKAVSADYQRWPRGFQSGAKGTQVVLSLASMVNSKTQNVVTLTSTVSDRIEEWAIIGDKFCRVKLMRG